MKKKSCWIMKTHLFKADEYICGNCGRVTLKPMSICSGCRAEMTMQKYDPSWVDEMEEMDMFFGKD